MHGNTREYNERKKTKKYNHFIFPLVSLETTVQVAWQVRRRMSKIIRGGSEAAALAHAEIATAATAVRSEDVFRRTDADAELSGSAE